MDKFYWESFKTFFRMGAFTIGGGYAMIPLIESEVVDKHKWIGREEFLDIMAIAQSCPGVFAVNMSVFIGYKLRRLPGAICATLGATLPSFIIILLIATFFTHIKDSPVVQSIFYGIRPAVVALIAAPTFRLAKSAKISLANCWIPILGAVAIWKLGVNPVVVIILAGLCGYLYGHFVKPTES